MLKKERYPWRGKVIDGGCRREGDNGRSVRFLTRYDGEVSEPLVGRQGRRVSMRSGQAVGICGAPGT